jgi:hypothetical protein
VATRNEASVIVLSQPAECGAWAFNWSDLFSANALSPNASNYTFESRQELVNDALSSRLYAKWFYSDVQPLAVTSTMFTIPSLPYDIRMEPCPFSGATKCLSNDTTTKDISLTLDTGLLDSHDHLGMNAPAQDRSSVRYVAKCSPIDLTGYVTEANDTTDGFIDISIQRLIPEYKANFTFHKDRTMPDGGYQAR